jgi:hypothetical protein
MTELTSKLQYKNYEKGEFTDQQSRNLQDTLTLIKNFPWDTRRGTDIQETGPGIIIAGENGDSLKVGLYFNGKLCLYYLDADNHMYEYHTDDMDVVNKAVTDFFAGSLDITDYDKHLFNIGNKAHFTTKPFEYKISALSEYARVSFLIIATVFYLILAIVFIINGISIIGGCVIFILGLFLGFMDWVIIKMYLRL